MLLADAGGAATSFASVVAGVATVVAALITVRGVRSKNESTGNVDLLIRLVDKKDAQLATSAEREATKDARIHDLETEIAELKGKNT